MHPTVSKARRTQKNRKNCKNRNLSFQPFIWVEKSAGSDWSRYSSIWKRDKIDLTLGHSHDAHASAEDRNHATMGNFMGVLELFSPDRSIGKRQDRSHSRISGWRLGWSTEKRIELGISCSWIAGLGGDQYRFYTLVGELYDPSRFFKSKPDHDDPEEDYSGGDYRNQQLVTDGRLKFSRNWNTNLLGMGTRGS